MLSPADLLSIAENLASRIPDDDAYAGERNASWRSIGKAYLKQNDFESASRALHYITDNEAQAELRVAGVLWAGDHLENERARDLVRDTVEGIESWEMLIPRRDLAAMVKPICQTLGEQAVHAMSFRLKDPFTAGNVLVSLAILIEDADVRREILRTAEEFAMRVPGGDRDYALRWVINGYIGAGLEEDERRARGLMSQDFDLMNESEAAMLRDVEKALEPLYPPEPDTPALRLRRMIDYGYNDLRVLFLAEFSEAGGLDDPESERLIDDPAFRTIAPPRPPSIPEDPSQLDVEGLARTLFDRPARQHDDDRSLLDGMGVVEISDLNRFADTVQEFFENFGEIAKRFTPEQVDQGLWYLFCDPIWLSHLVFDEIPSPQIATLTHAMYYPFRDYYMPMEMEYPGTAFYMWWDNFSSGCRNPALDEAAIAVLEKILALPSPLCREAALHGLNHLFPDPRAAALIDRYLDEHGRSLSKEEIEYAKACRAGDVI